MSRGTAGFVRDNLEAFAVAIAMALVIRHYCVEAFRIPTGSMMPSLYGDDAVTKRQGDRILVDKLAYLIGEPERWHVVVFLFPLNKGKNFIKRLVGLPGEWLHVRDGDIWTSRDAGATWAIARKPAGARAQLLIPYYPVPPEMPGAFARGSNWEADADWTVDEGARRFVVDAGDEARALRFRRKVVPYNGVDTGTYARGPFCGDVRIGFHLEVEREGRLEITLKEHGRAHRLVLGTDESYALMAGDDGVRHPLDLRLARGDDYEVGFANVDDMLVVDIDGDTFEFAFPPRSLPSSVRMRNEEDENDGHGITLAARELRATLTDVHIDRDVYYNAEKGNTPDGEHWQVPDCHFFMLGDNTRSSRDSREWRVDVAVLKNGDVIRWDSADSAGSLNPPAGHWDEDADEVVVVNPDINGLVRRFRARDVEEWNRDVPWPYVPRDHLIGRAFCVFWPIYVPPVYTGATRVSLIR